MSDNITVHNSGWELDRRPVDVVAISSQVVYGSVGNAASAGVLSGAIAGGGHRCVQVPTVLLGTLPHYPTVHGGPIPDEWLAGILDDLSQLDALSTVKYVIIGYLAHANQARIIADWFRSLQRQVSDVKLVVDPAMGDDDVGMYTDPAVAEAYRNDLVPLATGLTPNRFELSLLTGRHIQTPDDVHSVALELRPDTGWIVVTSALTEDGGHMATMANMALDADRISRLEHQRFASQAKGAGDLFAATVIARLLEGDAIHDAARYAGEHIARSINHSVNQSG